MAWTQRCVSAALGCALLCACDSSAPEPPPAVVRDSAGIQIVENHAQLWDADNGWLVEAEPALTIGVEDGDEAYEFQAIVDAERLDDGSIVVADALAAELRVFDAAGRFTGSIGRSGEGPGEFRNLAAVWRYRDSLATWDAALRRITVFDRTGNVGRIVSLSATAGGQRPAATAILGNGELIVRSQSDITPSLGEGVHRSTGEVLRYSAEGEQEFVISALAGEEWVGLRQSEDALLLAPRPFRLDGHIAVSGDNVYLGDSEQFDIAVFTTSGAPRLRIRVSDAIVPLTAEDVAAHIESTLDAQPNEDRRRLLRPTLERMPYPEHYPAFAGLLGDDDGNLWVAETPRAAATERAWYVFDSSGRWLGRVVTPSRARAMRASAGRLLMRHVDEDGVQTIRDHRIHKPDGTPPP